MKMKLLIALLVGFMAVSVAAAAAKAVNLSGTWTGKAQTPNGEDQVTLVLQRVKGVYSGTLSDSLGMATNAELTNVVFKESILTFDFTVATPDGPLAVHGKMKVEGGKMTGEWFTDSGELGAVELEKQPAPAPKSK